MNIEERLKDEFLSRGYQTCYVSGCSKVEHPDYQTEEWNACICTNFSICPTCWDEGIVKCMECVQKDQKQAKMDCSSIRLSLAKKYFASTFVDDVETAKFESRETMCGRLGCVNIRQKGEEWVKCESCCSEYICPDCMAKGHNKSGCLSEWSEQEEQEPVEFMVSWEEFSQLIYAFAQAGPQFCSLMQDAVAQNSLNKMDAAVGLCALQRQSLRVSLDQAMSMVKEGKEYCDIPIPTPAVPSLCDPQVIKSVVENAIEKDVLTKTDCHDVAQKCLEKYYGCRVDMSVMDTTPAPAPQKKDTFEQILELESLAAVKDCIVKTAPAAGYSKAKGLDLLLLRDLELILQDDKKRKLLSSDCVYQYVSDFGGCFKVYYKAGCFTWKESSLWAKRAQILELVRKCHKNGFDSPYPYPPNCIGIDAVGNVKVLPHLFVNGDKSKKLFETVFHSLMKLSDKQRGEVNNWNDYNCELDEYMRQKREADMSGWSRQPKKSRLHLEFLENSAMSGEDFADMLCPPKRKKKSTTANRKRPMERKEEEEEEKAVLKRVKEDVYIFDVSNINLTLE